MPNVTAREQASEHARVAAEVTSLLCSGHQLLVESGLPRTFPRVHWNVVDHQNGRDPSWVVCEDASDPTYVLMVRRAGRPVKGPTGYPQYRHTIRVAVSSRWPWRRWAVVGPNITRPEHLATQLAVVDARRRP